MKKIRFYRLLLIEIIETLCSICRYLETDGRYTHNINSAFMYGHFTKLKDFSIILREKDSRKKKSFVDFNWCGGEENENDGTKTN